VCSRVPARLPVSLTNFPAPTGGRRKLRRWVCRPLQDIVAINRRLDAVDELLERPGVASAVRAALRGPDIERCLGQVAASLAPPSEALPLDLATAAQKRCARHARRCVLSSHLEVMYQWQRVCMLSMSGTSFMGFALRNANVVK